MKKYLSEETLKNIIAESVKKVLNESKVSQYAEYIKSLPNFQSNFGYALRPGYRANNRDVQELMSFIDGNGPALTPAMEKKVAMEILGIESSASKKSINDLGYDERSIFNTVMEHKDEFIEIYNSAKKSMDMEKEREAEKKRECQLNHRPYYKTSRRTLNGDIAISLCYLLREEPWDNRGKVTGIFYKVKRVVPYLINAIIKGK